MAEQLSYAAEKALKDAEGKITDEIKIGVQAKIDEVKKVKDGADAETIKKATEALSTEMQKIGEYMAKNASQGEAQQEGNANDAKTEDEKKNGPDNTPENK